jgi:hypothetical protein
VRWRNDPRTEWLRLVDGGYFENSGAVTASEVVRNVRNAPGPDGAAVVPVVIHISNDPETTAPSDLAKQRKWLSQVVAPVQAPLNTRPARGFQAREDLAKRVEAHLHFRLCRTPDEGAAEARRQPLPLGWALSGLARAEMRHAARRRRRQQRQRPDRPVQPHQCQGGAGAATRRDGHLPAGGRLGPPEGGAG